MRPAFLVLAAIGSAAGAQDVRDVPPICTCDPAPQPRALPSDEALALGRRLALALESTAIAKKSNALVDRAEVKTGRPPEPPTYPNGPIRAVSLLARPMNPSWSFRVQTRVAEHVGLVYAWRYPLPELRSMVAFFESPAGERYLKDRGTDAPSAEIAEALRSPELDEDLLEVVCWRPVQTKTLGPHHDSARLHPPVPGFEPTPPPAWCR